MGGRHTAVCRAGAGGGHALQVRPQQYYQRLAADIGRQYMVFDFGGVSGAVSAVEYRHDTAAADVLRLCVSGEKPNGLQHVAQILNTKRGSKQMILQQFFSAGILFAMLGGVLGAVWASAKEHDTPFQFFIEAAVSAVAAAAVAENYLLLNQVWLCAISGAGVGLMTGTALDAAYALAPKISKGFVKGLAKRFLNYEDKE